MIFSSPTFLFLFLPLAFLLNLLLRRSIRASNALLIAASLLFYGWGEPVYVWLMVITTLVNYGIALGCEAFPARKKWLVALTIAWNIGLLAVFKYSGFLVDTLNQAAGLAIPVPQIALPIGLSFFTFQAMSYVLDVSQGKERANRNFWDVLLYISLFPQMVAGPIVKYHDVQQQLQKREITAHNAALGLRRFCFGLGKKVLIANTLAVAADEVFALSAAQINAPIAWIGAIAYLLQIYFDFSGYSDMALGLGRAFGFTFRENFDYPYVAQTMQDFWRRWHISLSSWFKEYVYIPLGGNRKGRLRTGVNKIVVFLLTGLWHGASWNFVLWGAFHGGFLMAESYGIIKAEKWPRPLRHLYTLLAVTVGFVLFRAETLTQAGTMIGNMFAGWRFDPELAALCSRLLPPLALAAAVAAVIGAAPLPHRIGQRWEERGGAPQIVVYAAALALLVLCALNLSVAAYNPFIYFRF